MHITDEQRAELINYAIRYGGPCRGCADSVIAGICDMNGTPCDPKVSRAVLAHAFDAWSYLAALAPVEPEKVAESITVAIDPQSSLLSRGGRAAVRAAESLLPASPVAPTPSAEDDLVAARATIERLREELLALHKAVARFTGDA